MSYFKGEPKKSMRSTAQGTMLQTVQDVLSVTAVKAIPERGLTLETCQHFGIRSEYSEVNGRVVAHYFPVTKRGKLVGFLKRDLTSPKKNAFSTVGDVTPECDLIGQDKCTTGRKLFIVEGQYDYPSLWQALRFCDYNRGREKPIIPNVVSIGLGTKNAAAHIGNNLDFIRQYPETVTVFDNDSANLKEAREGIIKGQDAVREVALILPEIKNVLLDLKDPNEYIIEGRSEDLQKKVTFDAGAYEADHIVTGSIGIEALSEPIKRGLHLPGFPDTMSKLHGLREAELTIVLAPPHVGKTTICKEFGYGLVKQGEPVAHIFLEEDLKKAQQSYIAMDNNVYLPKYRQDPSIIPYDARVKSNNELIDNGRTWWMDHFGSLNSDTLMQKIQWMHIKGARWGILDHISMVISGQESRNERKDIDLLMTELKAFTVASRMSWIVVSHIKRVNFQPPRDKEGVKYPYWLEVEADSGRGSGIFEQIADNIIILEPEVKEDGTRGLVRTKIAKGREWGWLGLADTFMFDPHTGRPRIITDDYM